MGSLRNVMDVFGKLAPKGIGAVIANALRTTSGPTDLAIGAIADRQTLVRDGATVVGADAGGGLRVLGPCVIGAFDFQTFNVYATESFGEPATGGYVTLSLGAETTAHVLFGADAATVKAALEALPSVGAGNVRDLTFEGALTDGGTVHVRFRDGAMIAAMLTGDASNLTGVAGGFTFNGASTDPAVVEMFTPAVGDVIWDFLHVVDEAFSNAGGDPTLLYTDNPADPAASGAWTTPGGGLGKIDLTTGTGPVSAGGSYTNFSGAGSADPNSTPTALLAEVAAAAVSGDWYVNTPSVCLVSVPIYAVVDGLDSAPTAGRVRFWVVVATPTPLMG